MTYAEADQSKDYRVRFHGKEYLLVAGGLTTPEEFERGDVSYAHAYAHGGVMRYGMRIGFTDEIEILEEVSAPTPGNPAAFVANVMSWALRCSCGSRTDVEKVTLPDGSRVARCADCNERIQADDYATYFGGLSPVTGRELQIQAAAAKQATRATYEERRSRA